MRQAYMHKKLSSRHLCETFDSHIAYELLFIPCGIKEHQIAIGKGFSAYMPVLNYSFRFLGLKYSVRFCKIWEKTMMKTQIKYLQYLFYELLNDYGQVYVAIKYSENSSIGNRGFTEEEKQKGLILTFNQRNYKTLQWTDEGSVITALGFGSNNKPEKCFLYFDDIVSVFSPYAKIRFDRWDMGDVKDQAEVPEEKKLPDEKVVSLDRFRKTKT
jgi:hypothetical protein